MIDGELQKRKALTWALIDVTQASELSAGDLFDVHLLVIASYACTFKRPDKSWDEIAEMAGRMLTRIIRECAVTAEREGESR
jgi:hypothetical protein